MLNNKPTFNFELRNYQNISEKNINKTTSLCWNLYDENVMRSVALYRKQIGQD
jgi:hypothetical protein